jgi:hypothetical protein
MPSKGRHIIAGIAWVVGSLAAWAVVCNLYSYVVFMYLANERQVRIPVWMDVDVYNWVAVGGIVLIPPAVAVLAIRGYLPGTGRRASKLRGFPVVNPRPSGPAKPADAVDRAGG